MTILGWQLEITTGPKLQTQQLDGFWSSIGLLSKMRAHRDIKNVPPRPTATSSWAEPRGTWWLLSMRHQCAGCHEIIRASLPSGTLGASRSSKSPPVFPVDSNDRKSWNFDVRNCYPKLQNPTKIQKNWCQPEQLRIVLKHNSEDLYTHPEDRSDGN